MRWMVVRKLTDPAVIATEKINNAKIAEVAPTWGVNAGRFKGAYTVHPPLNVPPWKNEIPSKIPEIK